MMDNCVKNKGKTHACRLSSGRIFKEEGRAAGIYGLCCLRIHTVQRFFARAVGAIWGSLCRSLKKRASHCSGCGCAFGIYFFRSPGEQYSLYRGGCADGSRQMAFAAAPDEQKSTLDSTRYCVRRGFPARGCAGLPAGISFV